MARPLRLEFAGALYHVTSRGNERRPIVRSDRDRSRFFEFLGQTVSRFGWSLTAAVLMTNHFHLVIQTPEPNLSRGMHWFNSAYAGWYNHTRTRCGHLYQGRFKALLIEKEAYLAEVLRYVVLNPVRAKMVERPEDYRWSTYRATAGLERAPAWFDLDAALAMFHSERVVAQENYREFVLAKVDSEEKLWDKLVNGIYLGTEAWTRKMRKLVEAKPRSSDHPRAHRAVGRPKMAAIVAAVAKAAGESAEAIRTQRGNILRQLVSWIGWHEGLATLASIASSIRLRSEGHVSNLIKRCDREFGRNPTVLGWLDASILTLQA